MSILLLSEYVNPNLLDKMPGEIRTIIIMSNNRLDKTVSSLLTSNKNNFEKNYFQTVNEFHAYIAQITYAIARHTDSLKMIKVFEEIVSSALSQVEDTIKKLHNREAMTLDKAIETISDYFKIMNKRDSIVLAFSTYLNLSVYIIALYKIIKDEDNLYQKNKTKLIQRCNIVTNQLRENIEIIISIEKVEQTIKESDTYLSNKQLRKTLAKEISNETLEYILKHLEFNNRIMYDKDGSIIWTYADESQQKILKEEFTMLC